MATIPLEDGYTDILGKAQRGLKLGDQQVAQLTRISEEQWTSLRAGNVDEASLRSAAKVLKLGADSLVALARKAWTPKAHAVPGLVAFNTAYEDMTVNAYLVFDAKARQGVVFDTGADSKPILQAISANSLQISLILLTHTHPDHIAVLGQLRSQTHAAVHVSEQEAVAGAQTFNEGKTFQVGQLTIETRRTWGHSLGGITYVVRGLATPVAVVGDALFAGSMGGGAVSFRDALETNRQKILTLPDDTVLCPGHGPLTTVGEEKLHNPFFPEFQT